MTAPTFRSFRVSSTGREAKASRPVSAQFFARELLLATRPHQWIKNVLVAAVPTAAGLILVPRALTVVIVAVLAFSLASAATYLVNDLLDVEADRLHPTKQLRPIAAGTLSETLAVSSAVVLASGAIGLASGISNAFLAYLLGYLILTSLYSQWLKHIAIVDVFSVAGGFVLRVMAGAVAIGAGAPFTLLVGVFSGAILISLGKRCGELGRLGPDAGRHRRVLSWYAARRVDRLMLIAQVVSLAAMSLWLYSALMPAAATAGIVAVATILRRFHRLALSEEVGDPVRLVLHDRTIIGALVVLGLLVVQGIYL